MMDQEHDATDAGSTRSLDESIGPIIDRMVKLTEAKIQQAIKPLEERIAALEAQLAQLTEESEP
jgi:polyhydroxyalkanoate synthesis regulator phasin